MEEEMTQLRQNKPIAIEENTAAGTLVAPDLNSKAQQPTNATTEKQSLRRQ